MAEHDRFCFKRPGVPAATLDFSRNSVCSFLLKIRPFLLFLGQWQFVSVVKSCCTIAVIVAICCVFVKKFASWRKKKKKRIFKTSKTPSRYPCLEACWMAKMPLLHCCVVEKAVLYHILSR